MCSNHQVSINLPVFPTTFEMCDLYPLVLQECSPPMCHQTGAYQVVGLACYYIKCHCFILLISIFSLLFCVLVAQDSLDAQVSPSCISDPGYLLQFSFMSKLSSHFRALSHFLAHRTPCCPVTHIDGRVGVAYLPMISYI